MTRKQFILVIIIMTFFSAFVGTSLGLIAQGIRNPVSNSPANIHEELEFFASSLNIILSNYVTSVEVQDLIEASVNGMLDELDPYSVYIDSIEYARLRENTSGSFGGLGIEIGLRNDQLTVIAPIENTPAERAGLVSGDIILEIDGESTEGITTEEAVQKLRGAPGSEVVILVLHPGHQDPQEITITREVINIHSVPFAGMIPGTNIGYIRLSNFYQNAGEEVEQALDSLTDLGAEKFILDLRGNPGGLLREAIDVSNNFLPKGTTIVKTNGRTGSNRFFAENIPGCPDQPLVLLLNFSSASASEIVGGAIQDHDRGLIIGSRSYGKGSVQSIFPLDRGNLGAIKLTTSRYYTPSGRLIDAGHTRTRIQREDNVEIADSGPFTTLGPLSREVYGGGGIYPDFLYYSSLLTPLETSVLSQGLYFTFARDYILNHSVEIDNISLSPMDYYDFITAVQLKEIDVPDTISPVVQERIIRQLEISIANAAFGSRGRYLQSLKTDQEVEIAVKLLQQVDQPMEIFEVANQHPEWQVIDSTAMAYEDSIRSEY